MRQFESLKLGAMNFFAWAFAAVSISDIRDIAAIVASLGAFGVSLASIWYIRKKGKALDKPTD